jgi:hypothetical protein
LEKGIEAHPRSRPLFLALSETCEKLGDKQKAADYQRRADALPGGDEPQPFNP